ncbi:MAG TPA: methyltransferase domain-containing protein [Kofleriaceae bacterium]|nr:methyltransferase domain-containing protein [Kofleriaceae bacterium]
MTVGLQDPISFWEQRHAALDPWAAGGDRGLTAEENHEFYAFRLGRIIELIRRHAGGERGRRILDAGCGRGHFTDGLRRCGHQVSGIDTSQTAIAWAIEHYGPHFEQSSLHGFRPRALFDVVVCIDVLFHVLDDELWRASLSSFGRAASAESVLVVTDAFRPRRFTLGNYIVHRSADEYDHALGEMDFVRRQLVPYQFGSNPNQFAAYCRSV